jgi:hypothetical protein
MDVILQNIFDYLAKGFTINYGLDWFTMLFGVLGGYWMAQKDRRGIACNIIACCSSFALALISLQYGFLVYNIMTLTIMVRAYAVWSAEARQRI